MVRLKSTSNIIRQILVLHILSIYCSYVFSDSNYAYPIKDPIAATVIGTPQEYVADLGDLQKPTQFKLRVFEDRIIPKYFWYNDKLAYGLLKQKKKAPLIFIIAGTGANYNGSKMLALSNAFYNAGFHVVMLPSPTFMSFIISASNSSVPGLLDEDSHDMYNVMKLAWLKQLKNQVEVSEFYLTGYSLGGAQVAYLANIDEHEKFFNFKKALLINTPVSLLNTAKILDDYHDKSFSPNHLGQDFIEFWNDIWSELTKYYSDAPGSELSLTPNFLFDIYKDHELSNDQLQALIAVAFRISAASITFTSDAMSHSGFIIPKGTKLKITTDISDIFVVAHRTGLTDYTYQLMFPFHQSRDPKLTLEEFENRLSLYPLEDYLRNSKKIGLMHNEDDIIMAPGDINWLKDVFGDRSRIYPYGGHLGNITYTDNIAYMLEFFKQ